MDKSLNKNTFTIEQKREIAHAIKPITLDEVNKEFNEFYYLRDDCPGDNINIELIKINKEY